MIPKKAVAGLLAMAFLFSSLQLFAQSSAEASRQDWTDFLHEQMDAFTRDEHIPNAVIALVRDGEIAMLRGYGYAGMEDSIRVDPATTMFRAGSVSKILTWLSVMQLHEQGLISLDDPVNRYLDEDMEFRASYRGKETGTITIIDLMNHTAGFANTFEDLFLFSMQPPLEVYLRKNKPPLIHPPGKVIAYSNYGTVLAGYIVERVSGLSFESYVEQHIFQPLHMQYSSFRQPPEGAHKASLAKGYRWLEGEFRKGRFEHMPAPAGGLSSSAFDMAQLMIAMLDRGGNGRLLQAQTMEKMLSTSFSYHPLAGGIAHGLIESPINGQHIVGHGGSTTLFDAGFYLLPDQDAGIFIAHSGGDYTGHSGIIHGFVRAFFPSELADEAPLPPALREPGISEVAGAYMHSLPVVRGPKKVLNLFFGSMQLGTRNNSLLDVRVYDQSFVFESLAPGIYKNTRPDHRYPYGPMNYLVAAESPKGKLMLVTDGPASFISIAWYERPGVAALILLPALLLALGSLLAFLIRFIRYKLRRGIVRGRRPKTANRLIIAHGLGLVLFLVLFMRYSEPHPVHLMPKSFFESFDTLLRLLGMVSWFVAALALVLTVVVTRTWWHQSGRLITRIYYSAYALWALALGWLLYFYQFMGI